MKNKEFIYKLLIVFAVILTCLSFRSYVYSKGNNYISYTIVLKEDVNGEQICAQIRDKYFNVKCELINNVNVIVLSTDNKDVLEKVKIQIKNQIEAIGKTSKIEEDRICKINFDLLKLFENNLFRKNYQSNNFSYSLREYNEKYEKWRWDTDKVTSNKQSYEIEQGSHNIRVAIIDSGIDSEHPDLKDNIVDEKVVSPDESSIIDNIGHGTMVAGVVASNGNLKGVAPKVAIIPYKVFKGNTCNSDWVVKGIVQATDDGNDVINLSVGSYKSLLEESELATYLAYQRAVNYAISKGCVVVASAGTEENGGFNISDPVKLAQQRGFPNDKQAHVPGGLPDVITVSATNKDDKLAFSNYGENISIAAPAGDYGELWETKKIPDISRMALVTTPTYFQRSQINEALGFDKGYEFIAGGTSLAAPKVSATVALIIAEYVEKKGAKPSIEQIKQYLFDGASPTQDNISIYYGKGIVNAYDSLKLIR